MTRYFIRSRHLAAKVHGGRVNIAFREMTAAEAEPHIRAKEKREAIRDTAGKGRSATPSIWPGCSE